jgi:hypothetical protein
VFFADLSLGLSIGLFTIKHQADENLSAFFAFVRSTSFNLSFPLSLNILATVDDILSVPDIGFIVVPVGEVTEEGVDGFADVSDRTRADFGFADGG